MMSFRWVSFDVTNFKNFNAASLFLEYLHTATLLVYTTEPLTPSFLPGNAVWVYKNVFGIYQYFKNSADPEKIFDIVNSSFDKKLES